MVLGERRPQSGLGDVHYVVAHCVAHKVGDGMKIQLAHDISAVGLRGLHRKIQRNCHFLAALALGQQLNDLRSRAVRRFLTGFSGFRERVR